MKKVNVFKIMVFLIVFLFSFLLNINKNTIESIDAVCISYDSSINYNNELLTSVIMRDFDFYLTSVLTPNGRAIDVYEIFGELPND